jgi:hypothetical protein
MQEEIHSHPQHRRARDSEGQMPEMQRQEIGAGFLSLPGKDLKKELIPIILCGEAGGDSLFLLFFSPISIPRYAIVLRINNFQTR